MAYTTYSLIGFTSGAANAKGVYAQIVAATPYASSRIHVLWGSSTANRFLLVDLATGAAGLETVIVANIALQADSDGLLVSSVALSVNIPAGTRLTVRSQAVSGATVSNATFILEDRALGSFTNPVTYGADTANTRGTQIDPGTTINTKGAYVQLSASTSARIDGLVICTSVAAQGTAITATTAWRLDIATGPAAGETVVIPDVEVFANTGTDISRPGIIQFPLSIPAGTRLAVRCECNRNTATERLLAVTLIGMQEPATGGGGAAGAVAYVG